MPRKWWTLVAVVAGVFMLVLDILIVNVALADIGKDFHSTLADLQWVVDAYALALAASACSPADHWPTCWGATAVRDRSGDIHGWLAAVRICHRAAVPRIGAGWPGTRRRRRLGDLAGSADRRVPWQGSRPGLRYLRCGAGCRRGGGPVTRRHHHQWHQLALDLLRQHSGRHRHHRGDAFRGDRIEEAGRGFYPTGADSLPSPASRPAHLRPDQLGRGLGPPQRLSQPHRRRRVLPTVPGDRGAARKPDAGSGPVPQAHLRRRPHRRVRPQRLGLFAVHLHRALPPAGVALFARASRIAVAGLQRRDVGRVHRGGQADHRHPGPADDRRRVCPGRHRHHADDRT